MQDSIAVAKTLKLRTSSTILLFPTLHNKTLLDSIYSPSGIRLETYSKEKFRKELVNQKETYFSQGQEDAKEYTPDFEQTWDENSYMKVSLIKMMFLLFPMKMMVFLVERMVTIIYCSKF